MLLPLSLQNDKDGILAHRLHKVVLISRRLRCKHWYSHFRNVYTCFNYKTQTEWNILFTKDFMFEKGAPEMKKPRSCPRPDFQMLSVFPAHWLATYTWVLRTRIFFFNRARGRLPLWPPRKFVWTHRTLPPHFDLKNIITKTDRFIGCLLSGNSQAQERVKSLTPS